MIRHWIDELAEELYEKLTGRGPKEVYIFNGGLSVSGLQHVGRLRGEIIITETLRKILTARGLRIKQYLTLYTQDAWKGKESQRRPFSDPEVARKYQGWPLINVPDPKGCHRNWVEHYWGDFGPFIEEFTDGDIEVVTTTEMYRGERMKGFIRTTLEKREDVRKVVNKYRGRKPYSPEWIPVEPVCEKCGRIDTTESIRIVDEEHVEYACENCGHRGITEISNGKLMWRIEWVGVWYTLQVDFEPYGKDHAMPGGSRDSCVDLAVNVFGIRPPEGLPYEWVEWRAPSGNVVDMGSSDFLGFTPREWVEVAHPHIYRFIVLRTPPMKKYAVGLHEVPSYYSQYFKAERIYYGLERAQNAEEEVILKRSYELSYPRGSPPEVMPEQVPYAHLAILSQIIPPDRWFEEGPRRLQLTGHLPATPTEYGLRRVREMMAKAYNWVNKYAPPDMRLALAPYPTIENVRSVPEEFREALGRLYNALSGVGQWNEEEVKAAVLRVTGALGEKVGDFYKHFYRVFTGKESGPRAVPLLTLLGKEEALKYLEPFKA